MDGFTFLTIPKIWIMILVWRLSAQNICNGCPWTVFSLEVALNDPLVLLLIRLYGDLLLFGLAQDLSSAN